MEKFMTYIKSLRYGARDDILEIVKDEYVRHKDGVTKTKEVSSLELDPKLVELLVEIWSQLQSLEENKQERDY